MSTLSEPTNHAAPLTPDVPPADEADEFFTAKNILEFVRNEAAKRDPANARHYAAASSARIKDGVDLAQRLLASHLTTVRLTTAHLQGRRGRGRRGRDATTDTALQEELSLVLALTWLEAAFGLLPPSRPPQDD
jgi:hypothetical protein